MGVVLACVEKEVRNGSVAYQTMYKEPPRTSNVFWATRAIKEKNAPDQSTVRKMKSAYVSMLLGFYTWDRPTDANNTAVSFCQFEVRWDKAYCEHHRGEDSH